MVAKEEGENEGELEHLHLNQSASHQKCDPGEGWQPGVLLIHQGYDPLQLSPFPAAIGTRWHEESPFEPTEGNR